MLTNERNIKILIKYLVSLSCLFVLMISYKAAWGNSLKVSFTPQEQAWLADHPEIRLGFNPHMEPLLIKGEDGFYDGIYPAIIGELEIVLGININIEVDDWDPIVQKARKREIDGLLACAPSQAEASKLLSAQPIHQAYPVAFTRHDDSFKIKRLDDLKRKRIAYQREVKMLEVALSQIKHDNTIIEVDSTLEAIRLVLEGKADVAFGVNFENYLVAKHALSGIKLSYLDLEHANPISTAFRHDWPEFVGIFNKGLKRIGKVKIQNILAEWTNIKEQPQVLELTPEDLAWLDAHPVIRVGADPNWAPIEFLNKDGNYSGLSMAYFRKIEPILGVRFEFVRENWQELIARAKQGQLDMFSCVAKTSEREKYLIFTESYVEMPAGIFAREETAYISNLSLIADEKVAVVEGYATHDYLVANYPDMSLVLVKTPEEGIRKLTQKKAFAFIDNTITTGYIISRKGYWHIKLTGEALFVYAQRMGIRKDWPQLRSILQKSIDSIPESERNAMYNEWVPLTYAKPTDYSLIWKIGVACFFTVFLFFLWNRKLKLEVHKRTNALLQSEEKYKAISEDMPVLICRFSPSGKISYVNDAYCKYFKKDKSKCLGDSFLAFISEKDRGAVWADITFLNIESPTQTHDLSFMTTKSETFWQRWTTRALFNDQGIVVAYQAIGEDITERKQAEESSRKSEKRFSDLVKNSPVGIFQTSSDWRMLEANDAMARILGYENSQELIRELKDMTNQLYVNPGDRVEWTRLLKENGFIRNLELRLYKKDGSIIWVSLDARISKRYPDGSFILDGFASDVNNRKKAEEALQESEEFLKTIVENIPHMIFVKDAKGLRFMRINKAGEELLGYPREELIGKNDYDFFPKENADFFAEKDRDVLSRGEHLDIPEEPIQTKYKGKRSLHTQKIPILDKEGKPQYLLGISEDITERKELEAQLQQAHKMESIGNLSGGIAHDFNNILFPIVGMSELLLEDLAPGSVEYENAQEILTAGKRGADLVKQILAFSRKSEHKMIPVRVQQVLKEVLKLSRSTIPKNIVINQDIQNDCGLVMADPTQLHQIAMNLITNAYHAVENTDGKIDVLLQEIALEGDEWKDSHFQPGRYVLLSVSDEGYGIPQNTIHRIFDPYFTTKGQGKGTGLGLAVVYGIVKEHNGDIKVYSEVDKGTTFNVYLPLMQKTEKAASDDKIEIIPTGTERILLVDDEEPIARLERQMLERLGYKVTERINSEYALETFKESPGSFDLVITDMTMPNITGDQLAREILSIRPDIPVVIFSGFSERINKDNAESLGVKGFLNKPVVRAKMAKMVRKVLDEAKSNSQE